MDRFGYKIEMNRIDAMIKYEIHFLNNFMLFDIEK